MRDKRKNVMLYNKASYSIGVDIKSDMHLWARNILLKAGYHNVKSDALRQYCSLQLRVLDPKPRKILKSKEFACPVEKLEALSKFEEAVKTGKNLIPYMSLKILDANYDDKFLYDWSFFHFHLGIKPYYKDPRFIERSDQLLITYVDMNHDDTMYFIEVRPHVNEVWYDQQLVRILADNWPKVIEKFLFKGQLSQTISNKDLKMFREKTHVNTAVDLGDGRVYLSMNWGISGAGTSARAGIRSDRMLNDASRMELAIQEQVDSICKTINLKSSKRSNNYTLQMIRPGWADYLFTVRECNVLLRLLLHSDGKLSIIVGDDIDSIDQY